jgi:hypothetical protein
MWCNNSISSWPKQSQSHTFMAFGNRCLRRGNWKFPEPWYQMPQWKVNPKGLHNILNFLIGMKHRDWMIEYNLLIKNCISYLLLHKCIVSVGQELGGGLAGWLQHGVSLEPAFSMSARATVIWIFHRLKDSLPLFPTKLVLTVGRRFQPIPIWTSSSGCLRMLWHHSLASSRGSDPREWKTESTALFLSRGSHASSFTFVIYRLHGQPCLVWVRNTHAS